MKKLKKTVIASKPSDLVVEGQEKQKKALKELSTKYASRKKGGIYKGRYI